MRGVQAEAAGVEVIGPCVPLVRPGDLVEAYPDPLLIVREVAAAGVIAAPYDPYLATTGRTWVTWRRIGRVFRPVVLDPWYAHTSAPPG